MSIQGIKATLLPNEADCVIVDKEIALRWSTEDTDVEWIQMQIYLWEKDCADDYDLDEGYWNGSWWVEDLPDYDYDDVPYDDDDFVLLPLVFRMSL